MPGPSLQSTPTAATTLNVVLAGNPNCGKTTVFNALTGLRAKVGNYPGVTVERKEGRLIGLPKTNPIKLLDLPGTYSLNPQSLDEQVAYDVLFHRLPDVPPPDLLVVILDASNLQRNLYFATQLIELGYRTVIALNMLDVAVELGQQIDESFLARELGAPVVPMIASEGKGIDRLRETIVSSLSTPALSAPRQFHRLPEALDRETDELSRELARVFPESRYQARAEALLVLSDARTAAESHRRYPTAIRDAVRSAQNRLDTAGVDWRSAAIEARYAVIAEIENAVTTVTKPEKESFSDRLDRVVTHRFVGPLIFLVIMGVMFQSIFSFAETPMNWLEAGIGWLGSVVERILPEGALRSLLVDGVIAGVGAVVIFLPQICLLFLFIGLLEDTGYMARAAFLMDRLMSRVGLHGKSFIPMLSSYACAIPGIMATRTIENRKDRLATILVAPLMSCSARLPVYTVLIGASISAEATLFGIIGLQGLTLLCMYLLGTGVALLMAWLFKRTLLKGPTPMLIMELPPYKRPLARIVLRHMWDRSKLFLRRAGTVILGIMIILWALSTYPKSQAIEDTFNAQRAAVTATSSETREEAIAVLDKQEAGEKLRHSFAGRMGRSIEPLIIPLGYDWKIGIGLIGSFAAREVFVSTMSLVYNVGDLDDSDNLAVTLQTVKRPDGTRVYTTLVCLSLMVFYVFALQCVSTIAIVGRETGSWKWAAFQWLYMTALAWGLAFVTYQVGRAAGWD